MSARSIANFIKRQLNNPEVKRFLVVSTLLLTAGLFVQFFVQHPEYWRALGHVNPWTIIWVLLLNAAMIVVLALSTAATLALCGKQLSIKENFMLTAYSSIANFFGPLQSGPGVRAVYLKTKHQVRLRDYTLASLIPLGMFACFSALFLLVGMRPWWQTALAFLVVGAFSWAVIWTFQKKDKHPADTQFAVRPSVLAALVGISFLQVCLTVAWYYIELRAVHPGIRFSQAVSYAGAANFSMYVSITPDGFGIREAFLVFSRHIHHVSTADIVSANIIDRAAYVLFLGVLFFLVLSLHAKDKLQLASLQRAAAKAERSPR